MAIDSSESVFTPVASRFQNLLKGTCCPYAQFASISFGPAWQTDQSTRENLTRLLPYFDEFAERAEDQKTDMFVVEVREPGHLKNIEVFSAFLRTLLTTLKEADPLRTGDLADGIDSPEWDFTYRGVRFFVLTFAPFYDERHGRHSHCEDTAFITFQPDQSFDRYGINKKSPKRRKISEAVRDAFEKSGIRYDFCLVTRSIKALRYVQPLGVGQDPIRWWEEQTNNKSSLL